MAEPGRPPEVPQAVLGAAVGLPPGTQPEQRVRVVVPGGQFQPLAEAVPVAPLGGEIAEPGEAVDVSGPHQDFAQRLGPDRISGTLGELGQPTLRVVAAAVHGADPQRHRRRPVSRWGGRGHAALVQRVGGLVLHGVMVHHTELQR